MPDERHLLTDIRIQVRHREFRPVYTIAVDSRRVPTKQGLLKDMGKVSGPDNLAQAVILRLLTPKGELSELGHPEYGSRLHELIGSRNTETVRNLAKLYILESLKREPRVEKVTEISVEPALGSRDRINILLHIKPVGMTGTVAIGPFTLELEK